MQSRITGFTSNTECIKSLSIWQLHDTNYPLPSFNNDLLRSSTTERLFNTTNALVIQFSSLRRTFSSLLLTSTKVTGLTTFGYNQIKIYYKPSKSNDLLKRIICRSSFQGLSNSIEQVVLKTWFKGPSHSCFK